MSSYLECSSEVLDHPWRSLSLYLSSLYQMMYSPWSINSNRPWYIWGWECNGVGNDLDCTWFFFYFYLVKIYMKMFFISKTWVIFNPLDNMVIVHFLSVAQLHWSRCQVIPGVGLQQVISSTVRHRCFSVLEDAIAHLASKWQRILCLFI